MNQIKTISFILKSNKNRPMNRFIEAINFKRSQKLRTKPKTWNEAKKLWTKAKNFKVIQKFRKTRKFPFKNHRFNYFWTQQFIFSTCVSKLAEHVSKGAWTRFPVKHFHCITQNSSLDLIYNKNLQYLNNPLY